jgi:uncharacterized protein YecT (DUF1311 family)
MRRSGKSSDQLVKEEVKWLKSRGSACAIPDSDRVLPNVSPDVMAGCLKSLYENRIHQLETRAQYAQ